MYVRFIFKRDEESSIGRGAIIRSEHFEPEIARIFQVVAEEAPPLRHHELWVTEGYRMGEGLHPECKALDFRVLNVIAPTPREKRQLIHEWAKRVSARLGSDYDVVVHGEGENLHMHVEYDRR